METIEGNIIIAEFMGGKYKKDVEPLISDHMNENDIWLPMHGIESIINLKYRSSWDWLMPVIEKIDSLTSTQIIGLTCIIWVEYNEERTFLSTREKTKIESVWLACIEFIKWYNKNK